MSNNKRKRAVVLALIAFFCGATAFVSVDWKRFGGGFLAFFKHKSEPLPAYASGSGTPSGSGTLGGARESHAGSAPLPQLVALAGHRHADHVGGSGGRKPDEDLFKYGDPAAGGIPPGSFLVAQNDTAGNGNGGAGAPTPVGGAAPETAVNPASGDSGDSGGGVSSPAPAPGGTGGAGDGGILLPTPTPSPSPAPTPPGSPPPPVVSPPTSTPPAPTPTQSGTSGENPGNGGGDLPPVSAVPEASDAAMMGLGALFLAVAAARRRRNDQA